MGFFIECFEILAGLFPFRFECGEAGFHSVGFVYRDASALEKIFRLEELLETEIQLAGIERRGCLFEGANHCGIYVG